MLATADTAESLPAVVAAQSSGRTQIVAVALMSFSALLLELGLTRLFSVVLFYHFAFLAISIALLGLGAGAVFAHLRREWLARWTIGATGREALCAANACFIILALEVVLHTVRFAASSTWPNFWRLTVLYLAAAVPFFITGLLFSHCLRATSGAHHPALWRRLAGRFAGVSGAGAAAEPHRRPQTRFCSPPCRRCGRSGMGRRRARVKRLPCASRPFSHW